MRNVERVRSPHRLTTVRGCTDVITRVPRSVDGRVKRSVTVIIRRHDLTSRIKEIQIRVTLATATLSNRDVLPVINSTSRKRVTHGSMRTTPTGVRETKEARPRISFLRHNARQQSEKKGEQKQPCTRQGAHRKAPQWAHAGYAPLHRYSVYFFLGNTFNTEEQKSLLFRHIERCDSTRTTMIEN